MKIKLKLRGKEEIKRFDNVKSAFLQDGFLFIVTKISLDIDKTEPIELSLIDYYEVDDGN